MDRISVSADGLRDAHNVLQHYMEQVQQLTANCDKLLSSCGENLDEGFRKDVQNYVESLKQFQRDVEQFTEENQDAIIERIHALGGYCSTTYQKRAM